MLGQIAIYGVGGQGRTALWAVRRSDKLQHPRVAVCFIDDDHILHGTTVYGVPVLGLEEALFRFPTARVTVAMGSPAARKRVTERCSAAGFGFETIIDPSVVMSPWTEIGEGSLIMPGNVLAANVRLGQHVHIMLNSSVGHDVALGDYVMVSPGVNIAGHVRVGSRTDIGIGAAIINGTPDKPLTIGRNVVIGAGAVVTHDIPDNATAVGVPARVIKIGPNEPT